MISFELDDKNNLVTGGNINTISGNAALIQDIKNALMMWRNEYPFDVTKGIDYAEFIKTQDKQALLFEIQKRITSDYRVQTVDIDTSKNGRGLSITIKTIANSEVQFELD